MRTVVELALTVPAPSGGRWFAHGDGSAEHTADPARYFRPHDVEAREDPWDLLPSSVQHLRERWDEMQEVVRAHVSEGSFDELDLAGRWDDEAARLLVLEGLDALEQDLAKAIGPAHEVRISREPAVTEVRMAGEYGSTWPLGAGTTDREDWPMISDRLADQLTQWAILADPDSDRRPPSDVTERVVRDLRRELGDRYVLTVDSRY